MGVMYAMQCDVCQEIQVKKTAHEIKGKTYIENGQTKFTCAPCSERLKAALALDKKGLEDPLRAVGRLLQEKDDQIRNLELANAAKSGDFLGVARELEAKKESAKIPVIGLDFESEYKKIRTLPTSVHEAPALPAPKPKGRRRKK